MLGQNMAADEVVAGLLDQARDSGRYVADVVIEREDGTEPAAHLRIFLPLYDTLGISFTMEGRRKNIEGFVFGVFDLGPTLEAELALLGPGSVDIELWEWVGQARRLIHTHASRTPLRQENSEHQSPARAADLATEHPLHVVGIDWTARCTAAPAFLKQHARRNHWWVLSGGLIITLASCLYLRVHLTRAAWAQRLVAERTEELLTANDELAKEVAERQAAEAQLRMTQERLVEAARRAGMADVASEVLHNVGNILNSINVSTTQMTEMVSGSRVATLEKVVALLSEHRHDLGTFLTQDPKGQHIPVFLVEVSRLMKEEEDRMVRILEGLSKNVRHVKDTISMQQSYAKVSGIEERTALIEVIEDAIQINRAGLDRHGVRLVCEFEELPPVYTIKQKLLQILVNLVNNGKYALSHSEQEDKIMHIRLRKQDEDRFRIQVADNGVGIDPKHRDKIFQHGFTTKKDGHGFGLHSSALAAQGMGGSLSVYSAGLGKGATFTLELPIKQTEATTCKTNAK
jgi:C4-dicarboxylate-specific signal transduction histidine kinase